MQTSVMVQDKFFSLTAWHLPIVMENMNRTPMRSNRSTQQIMPIHDNVQHLTYKLYRDIKIGD
jgi:hypothetical protein